MNRALVRDALEEAYEDELRAQMETEWARMEMEVALMEAELASELPPLRAIKPTPGHRRYAARTGVWAAEGQRMLAAAAR